MRKGDKVYVINLEENGRIIDMDQNSVTVKLDSGKIIRTVTSLIVILEAFQSLWDKIKSLFQSIFR